MSKQIAVVTGGMGGIGTAICRSLKDQGYNVVAAYSRDQEQASIWQKEQEEQGYEFNTSYVDVTNYQSCEDMINQIEENIGPISILVNNAGITRDSSLCKMKKEDWDIVISTDLNSIFYMTHATLPRMKERGFGRIINISSINGQKGQFGQVNYSAAKAGMHGFTKSLALEVAKNGITVNTISPGYVATSMVMAVPEKIRDRILAEIPMGRFAEPDEVASVVSFLANKNNSYITGANIPINGGHYMQ